MEISEQQIKNLKECLQENILTVLDGMDDGFLTRVCGMIINTVDENLQNNS